MSVYFVLLSVICVLLLLFFYQVLLKEIKNKTEIGRSVLKLLGLSEFAVLSNMVVMFSSEHKWSLLFLNLYFAIITWLAVFMLQFVSIYTGFRVDRSWFFKLVIAATLVDTVLLGVNNYKSVYFKVVMNEGKDRWFPFNAWTLKFQPPAILSMAISYLVAGVTMYLLFKKTRSGRKTDHRKYGVILYTYIFICILNLASLYFISFAVDFAVLFYSSLVLFICQYACKLFPKRYIQTACEQMVYENHQMVLYFDDLGSCIWMNRSANHFFFNEEKFSEKDVEAFVANIVQKRPRAKEELYKWTDVFKKRYGRECYFSFVLQYLKEENQTDSGFCLLMEDRTEEIRLENIEKFRHSHDDLTGIYNRNGFFTATEVMLEAERRYDGCVLAVDVKDFKLVNDLFGMEFCDSILKKIGNQLKNALGEKCICGRISGDKFAVLCLKKEFSEEKLEWVSESIQGLFADRNFHIRLYYGVYWMKNDGRPDPVQAMYNKANMALRSIWGDYNKAIAYYDDKLREQILGEKALLDDFESSVSNGDFCLYLQPQVNIEGEVLGAEALVRWNHPKQGLLMPYQFISLFEKRGVIHRLDCYVWELAVKKLREWKQQGKEKYYISINISAKDFVYMNVQEILIGLTQKYDVSPSCLKLEITESALNGDVDYYISEICRLKEAGFSVEIDDFGSGYSSLNILKEIPANVLKLDRVFLSETQHVERRRGIVEGVIFIGKSLNMEIVAEGVETREQVDTLKRMGVKVFQGFYFHKPMDITDFERQFLAG